MTSTQPNDTSNPLFNLLNGDSPPIPPPEQQKGGPTHDLLKNFTHEQLMQMYQQVMKGEVPPELATIQEKFTDENGKPIVDSEGGAVIQPEAGFVVKTKDKDGQKVFINMTMHEMVDAFEERKIPQGEREQLGTDTGIRIPLSLGTVREDYDKKGEAA